MSKFRCLRSKFIQIMVRVIPWALGRLKTFWTRTSGCFRWDLNTFDTCDVFRSRKSPTLIPLTTTALLPDVQSNDEFPASVSGSITKLPDFKAESDDSFSSGCLRSKFISILVFEVEKLPTFVFLSVLNVTFCQCFC